MVRTVTCLLGVLDLIGGLYIFGRPPLILISAHKCARFEADRRPTAHARYTVGDLSPEVVDVTI